MKSPSPSAIKSARAAARVTQAKAAAVVGYSRRAWQSWENGTRSMRPHVLKEFKKERGLA